MTLYDGQNILAFIGAIDNMIGYFMSFLTHRRRDKSCVVDRGIHITPTTETL